MSDISFKCPYCGKKTRPHEKYCDFCEHDISKVREELEKPKCFIATAAYGTPFAQEINVLRRWRDKSLIPNPVGNIFVETYYKVSPPIARFISKRDWLRKVIRILLKPIVKILS